jgi:hypothetical protein
MTRHYSVTGKKSPSHQRIEPLSYSISECTEMGLGSRASVYKKIHEGVLVAFKDGARTRVEAASAHTHHADLVASRQGIGLGPPVGRAKAAADKSSTTATQPAE